MTMNGHRLPATGYRKSLRISGGGRSPVAGSRSASVFVAAALIIAPLIVEAAEVETCYRDDTGRIVTRRRPGYVEVPCPAPGEPRRAPTTEQPQSIEDTG